MSVISEDGYDCTNIIFSISTISMIDLHNFYGNITPNVLGNDPNWPKNVIIDQKWPHFQKRNLDFDRGGFTWDKVKMSLIDLDLPDLILITLEFFFRNLNFKGNLFQSKIARKKNSKSYLWPLIFVRTIQKFRYFYHS